MTESEFHELVALWLEESFARVEHEPRVSLPESAAGSYLIPDFIAHTPFDSYVIEVEDDIDSLETGLGQALRYADLTGFEPVVVLPADEWERSKRRIPPVEIVTV